MISAMENILQSYFHRSTLEEVDIREVEQWASQYPYFAQAQFLLAFIAHDRDVHLGLPHIRRHLDVSYRHAFDPRIAQIG